MTRISRRRKSALALFCCLLLLPLVLLARSAVAFGFLLAPSFAPRTTYYCLPLHHARQRRRRRHLSSSSNGDSGDDDDDDDDAGQSEPDFQVVDDEEDDDLDLLGEEEYGKFEKESKMHPEDEATVPPLPAFLTDNNNDSRTTSSSSSSTPKPWHSPIDETQRRMEDQQRQIDMLMNLVQRQQQSPESDTSLQSPLDATSDTLSHPSFVQTQNVVPLKAMLFIDGTWLYYSIHERNEQRCPFIKKYGRGWQMRYQFDWAALPRVVSEQLQQEQQKWDLTTRPVEIVRASVYTSVKKDTSRFSNRIRMFQDMQAANYDVFIMETVGPGEKCVDIQLAVEMLHYATVPNAYDVAILLSGDKDFLPALVRTRQKGRKVGIVSMRTGCNRALYETPNVKDYDVVWIEDYLDRLMIPRDQVSHTDDSVSAFTLTKVIYDFIQESGLSQVSSRDIGRYLKSTRVGKHRQSLLDELKQIYGGLHQFLTTSGCFNIVKRKLKDEVASQRIDPSDKTFFAALHPNAELLLLEEARRTHFTPEEKEFFETYSLEQLGKDERVFMHSQQQLDPGSSQEQEHEIESVVIPEELKRDYSKCKVAELKELCRERGLPVSGTKAVLLERIQSDVEQQVMELEKEQRARIRMKRPSMPGRLNGESQRPNAIPIVRSHSDVSAESEQYLEGLIKEYIQASGGKASSRDIGRYLAANGDSGRGSRGRSGTALTELKNLFGGLTPFILSRPHLFVKFKDDSIETSSYEFQVAVRH